MKNLLSLEKLSFFAVREDHMLGHELVVRDVHEQLLLQEHLEVVRYVHLKVLDITDIGKLLVSLTGNV